MTQDELKARLSYEPDTGIFRWKVTRPGGMYPGDIAGWHNGKNMIRINFGGKCYLAHRLAWFYTHNEWPPQIDHINGNRRDNRLCNLRPASNAQNQANNHAKRNNKLGIRGISADHNGYRVQLRKGEKKISKYFATLDAAKQFAVEASKRLHGDYSVHSRTT